jgi:hypothetical protein
MAATASNGVAKPPAVGSLNTIASKWGVPPWVLAGVYGMETDFGKNVTTSSAGAIGLFQFLPSTAAGYSYPLTNTPTASQAVAQAEGAAHYLSDLFKQTGSWNAALQRYSGGNYGEAQVKAKAPAGGGGFNPLDPFGLKGPTEKAAAEAEEALGLPVSPGLPGSPFKSPTAAIESIWGTLTDPATWLRILKVVGGLALGYLAIRQLTETAKAQA